ncbi:MAG: hypothetical protein IJK23_03930 [Clostridia bacterium]|nr:hypothetical protein [Clostridia bacterium]
MKSRTLQNRFSKTDLAAAVTFVALAVFLVFSAYFSDMVPDEAYYYTLPQRFLQGDGMFAQEWEMSQIHAVFLFLPYLLYTRIAGGTDGIILFMRYLFIFADLALYCWFYRKLREYGAAAVAASALFCADQFFGILALNYYNMALTEIVIFILMLFFSKKELSAPRLFVAGIVLSCAVLNQISLAILYILYTVFVMIRLSDKKDRLSRFSSVLAFRNWLWITAGVAVCAAAFLIYLQATVGLAQIMKTLPDMFINGEYEMKWYGNSEWKTKFGRVASVFGVLLMILLPLFALVCAILMRKRKSARLRAGLAYASFALYLLFFIRASFGLAESFSEPMPYSFFICFYITAAIPVYVFGFIFYLLCDHRDKKMLVFWIAALCASACVDYISYTTIAYGARLAYFFTVYYQFELIRELRGMSENGREPRTLCKSLPRAVAVLLLICQAANISFQRDYVFINNKAYPDASVDRIETGPLRGTYNNAAYVDGCYAILADLDRYKSVNGGKAYIPALLPYTYLYLDQEICANTAYFVAEDFPEQICRYWGRNPSKRPTYIYIPYNAMFSEYDRTVSALKQVCECVLTEGSGGAIAQIIKWNEG